MIPRYDNRSYIYGRHAIKEAFLHNPKCLRKVFLGENARDEQFEHDLKLSRIPLQILRPEDTKRMVGDAVHQGFIAECDPDKLFVNLRDFLASNEFDASSAVVVLDELTDPHNVGAIIRSAAAFGASAVMFPEHNQVQATGAVIKASAGMAFRIPLVRIGNLNQALRALKEKGFWIYGLDMEGKSITKEKFTTPVAFVVGNEAEGVHTKTLEHCDITLSIPMSEAAESLNASVATAVTLYEWAKQGLVMRG